VASSCDCITAPQDLLDLGVTEGGVVDASGGCFFFQLLGEVSFSGFLEAFCLPLKGL
jgi:hypothetical protein